MRILLIDPVLGTSHLEPHLGLLSLGEYVSLSGHNVYITSLAFDNSLDRLNSLLLQFRPEIVGVSVYSTAIIAARNVVRTVKAYNSSSIVVAGGPHATIIPNQCLKDIECDYVIPGEAELGFQQFLDCLASGRDPLNLAFVASAKKLASAYSPRVLNLDDIPISDRSRLDTFGKHCAVSTEGLMPEPCTTIIASRGCPGQCIFCQPLVSQLFGKNIRYRSTHHLAQEIEYLKNKWHIASIQFADDTIIVNSAYGRKFMDTMKSIGLPWAINIRANGFSRNCANLLAQSGCHKVLIGVESGSDSVLKKLKKGITTSDIKKTIHACHEFGIIVRASFMVGSPGESEEDLKATIRLIEECKPESLSINYTKPTVGSELFYTIMGNQTGDENFYRHLSNRKSPSPEISNLSEDILVKYYNILKSLR